MLVPRFEYRSSTSLICGFILGFVVLIAGCASVDPAPFVEFSSSLQPLRAGTDVQAGAAAEASRQNLIRQVADGEVSTADLQLQVDAASPFTTSYDFAENEPNFVKLIHFRSGLSVLNDTMISYAHSLAVLAGGGPEGDFIPTQDQFDQMARDLNANAGTAAAALGIQVDPNRQALLSTAAVTLFKAYIESKRRHLLRDAIKEVQPQVEEFAEAAQQATRFLAELVVTNYSEAFLPLATAEPPNATPILALNDTTQGRLATLESLWRGYGALPGAHRDLAAATSTRPGTLVGLIAFTQEATRLQGLVDELAKANAAAADTTNTR